ncbi:MAG: DUF2723 domain-containing protein [Ardenticatenaceae bacterium]|nr:DUF2723 domain-containing protein [Ardenticatenaceae bacterium]
MKAIWQQPRLAALKLYVLRFTLLFIFSLAATRLLYEGIFPNWLWLARPFPATLFALALTLIIHLLLSPLSPLPSSLLTPLLLNLFVIFNPTVDLVQSRLILAASVWLTAVLITHHHRTLRPFPWFGLTFILAGLLPIYLLTMPHTVGRADTFEFQVVAPQLGIAHPTGYPLYLLLAKVFTFIPFGSVAWRINLASAVLALAALTILYLIILQLDFRPLPALLGAVAVGLTPTFWSQAIEAEVYALHALVVVVALWLILQIGDWGLGTGDWRLALVLAFVVGMGLTNHLTTVFLIPAAVAATIFALHKYGSLKDVYRLLITDYWLLPKLLLAAIAPLTLYAYLPLRWAAVNEDRMGFGRFVDWVIGGRFQGALQWSAWRTDFTRYEVVGRLFVENWGYVNLALAVVGLIYLLRRRWRTAVLLLITWFGFSFYALNYYVPDLAVFLIPAQLIIGICWAAGVMAIGGIGRLETRDWRLGSSLQSLVSSLLFLSVLLLAIRHWPQLDRSAEDGLTQWGTAVLHLPLAENAAILADSEKIAPLYYLQQAEGMRPDLDIMVLPDEAAYRAELNGRIAHQTIYLARFLPGLEGAYHLRSVGPLTEVSTEPLRQLPPTATPMALDFGPISLLGYEMGELFAEGQTAVTLYWQATQPLTQLQQVYLRWEESQTATAGQHPANNNYPTLAWKGDEIVADFHLLPNPIAGTGQTVGLHVALAPPFTPASDLAWQLVTVVDIPPTGQIEGLRPLRAQFANAVLTGIHIPATIRPQTPLPVTLTGFGDPHTISLQLSASSRPAPRAPRPAPRAQPPFTMQTELDTNWANGRYALIAQSPEGAVCGWWQTAVTHCIIGEVEISGVPLPAEATNYEDKIALLRVELATNELQPGGQLPLTLHWQSLAAMDKDYTVFIQVLNEQDQIVGQVDAWPLQGTLPTSQWSPGDTIVDPYLVQLASPLPPGTYRLIIGWYLLADARRLTVLDENGRALDDKWVVPNLYVPAQ